MSKKILPNFVIVGAMKSGTTTLWYHLRQHPDIFMPSRKELRFLSSSHFFDGKVNTYAYHYVCDCDPYYSIEDYLEEFTTAGNKKAVGEASPQYLYNYSTTIPVIKKYIGDPRIIIILRDPVERAYSAYKHTIKDFKWSYFFKSPETFEEYLDKEEQRKVNGEFKMMYFGRSLGLYYEQVKAYMENFSNVKVCLYDDLKSNPGQVIKELYEFLGVRADYDVEAGLRRNVTPPANTIIQRILFSETSRKILAPIMFNVMGDKSTYRFYEYLIKNFNTGDIKSETRNNLKDFYRNDIIKLQGLLDRDLSSWLVK